MQVTGNSGNSDNKVNIAVIGAGAAGLLCSCLAAENGAQVTLFEKNKSQKHLSSEEYFDNAYLGKKLLVTGKGRCNLTNDCTSEEFISSVMSNPKFLYASYKAFPPKKVMEYFESLGVELKTERGNRVFPASDKSLDVLRALKNRLKNVGVKVINEKICSVSKSDGGFVLVDSNNRKYEFERVVICTGGVSYPQTGSDGDGYKFAADFGHEIIELKPSLVPLECKEAEMCSSLSGLTLKNICLNMVCTENGKTVFSKQGELLFTHFGISGPLVLSASAHMRSFSADKYRADIDLKPALDVSVIDERLVGLFSEYPNRDIVNVLGEMLPKSMCEPFCRYCGVLPNEKPNGINKGRRRAMAESFKKFSIDISAFRPISEAIVTAGGVSVKQINPSTMESKLEKGLYFAGEVMDVDAYTGGFNLQIAFSTAYLAAKSAASR